MQAYPKGLRAPKKIHWGVLLPLFLIFSNSFLHAQTPVSAVQSYDELISAIREVRRARESRVEAAVEQEKVREAWETGKLIDEHILLHKERQSYGEQVVVKLARDLGTSETELRYMLQFARTYPIHRPADELSWSHYQSLLSINDEKERKEVIKEATEKKWNRDQVREEVAKRKAPKPQSLSSPSEKRLSSPSPIGEIPLGNALAGDPKKIKLPVPGEGSLLRGETKPGKVGMYRVVETTVGPNKGKLAVDLGFDNFYEIRDMGDLRAGDIVKVGRDVKISPTDTTATRQKYRSERGFFHFTKVLPKSAEGKILLNAPKNPIFADDSDLYTYEAYVSSVYDGDTFHALINLGFGLSTEQRVRLRQLDAPEILTGEGKEAKAALEKALLTEGGKIIIKVEKSQDQHGRYIADVWVKSNNITQELLDSEVFTVRGDG